MGSLGVLFMIAGFALWCISPSDSTGGTVLGISPAFRFRADGSVLILSLAALWYCRETDEPMHIVLPIAGLACLLYGLISYFVF